MEMRRYIVLLLITGIVWASETKHLPENTGDKPHEVILVELKN